MISIIACDHQEIFFKYYEQERESEFAKVSELSRLETEILPFIFQHFNSKDPDIQKSIIEFTEYNYRCLWKFIDNQKFLFKSLKKRPEIEN
jgi:hypothetical protein